MLTQEENEILTRVGPGSAMGQLLRRYWIPALLSSELPEANGDPLRVLLLGERFVAWRDGEGRVALFDEHCMHRGASLALGRCEGDGLRCLYHGWKFATDGAILDTPNFKGPAVKEKLRAPVYPTREAGELIWVYLGAPDLMPEVPSYSFMTMPPERRGLTRTVLDVNFVQVMEGNLDSSHAGILHKDFDPFGRKTRDEYGQFRVDRDFSTNDDAPTLEVEDTAFGFHSVALRDVAGRTDAKYGRVHTWVRPFMTIVPPRAFVFCVPLSDHQTSVVLVRWHTAPMDRAVLRGMIGPRSYFSEYTPGGMQHYDGSADNGWHQDRGRMRRGESFSGIDAITVEDAAVTNSMGPVYDRSREHLVPGDVAVIRMRRQLLRAAQQLQDGIEPAIPTAAETATIQGGEGLVREGERWQTLVPNNVPLPGQENDGKRIAVQA